MIDLSFLKKYSNNINIISNKYNEYMIYLYKARFRIYIDVGKYNDKTYIISFKTNDNGTTEIVNNYALPNNEIDKLQHIIEEIIFAKQYQMLINNFYKNCKADEMTNKIMNHLYHMSHLYFEDCLVQICHYEDGYLQVCLYNGDYEICLQIDMDDNNMTYDFFKDNKLIKVGECDLNSFVDIYYQIYYDAMFPGFN